MNDCRTRAQWSAWVAAAHPNDQAARLLLVPDEYRDEVRRHLATLDAMATFYQRKHKGGGQ